MSNFCAAIKIDLVLVFKFYLLRYSQIIPCPVSLFCRLKLFHTVAFSFYFGFLNFLQLFFSVHSSFFFLFFFVFCFCFLLILATIRNSSFDNFKKGPEYLTRETAQIFVPLMRFLQSSFKKFSSSSKQLYCETKTYLHHEVFQHYLSLRDNTLREQYRNNVVLAGVLVVRSRVWLPILDPTW